MEQADQMEVDAIAQADIMANTATADDASQEDMLDTDMNEAPAEVDDDQDEEVLGEPEVARDDAMQAESGAHREARLPHYALPPMAFDARRKSLPAFDHRTPVKVDIRPNTSDGASMPRIVNPFANAWWARSHAGSAAITPIKFRPSTAHTMTTTSNFETPAKSPAVNTPIVTPKERFPRLAARPTYEEHAKTVAAAARFSTPADKSPKRRETFHKAIQGQTKRKETAEPSKEAEPVAAPQATPRERYPRMKPRENHETLAKTVAAPARFSTPSEKSPKRRDTFHKALPGQIRSDKTVATSTVLSAVSTPQQTPGERYPRLGARQNYEEHAKTVAPPVRFQTPVKTPLKRPATTQKPESLRKAALTANTPLASHSLMKTPLKAPGMTPSQAPMTPHPAAPLRGVVALVEVFTLEGASASAPFTILLHRLGAKTTRAWSDRITHVIFKDGSPTTLQRVRLNNKDVHEKATGAYIHCVNSRWVNDCDTEGTRMDETDEAYVVDVDEVPRGGKRRRKSMEPSALMNVGGNIVRDRKSSIGRRVSSLGRSPMKFQSPAKPPQIAKAETPKVGVVEKENSGDEQGSPATPAWIAAPEQLVQQTAPMNHIRKLDLQNKDKAKNRRLTFWSGAA